MCGIYFCLDFTVKKNSIKIADIYFEYLKYFLSCRGPDCCNSLDTSLQNSLKLSFKSHVLHTIGPFITSQPVTDESGNILLWNGNVLLNNLKVSTSSSDTLDVFKWLKHCHTDEEVRTVFQRLQGPWSFVFWQEEHHKLWFGRDVFGRRSLLGHLPSKSQPILLLSSTYSQSEDFPLSLQEVPANGLYCLEIKASECENIELQCHPWTISNLIEPSFGKITLAWKKDNDISNDKDCLNDFVKIKVHSSLFCSINRFNSTVESPYNNYEICNTASNLKAKECHKERTISSTFISWEQFMSEEFLSISNKFLHVLQEAVKIRVLNQPPYCQDCIKKFHLDSTSICRHSKTAILFSGGIDSMILAVLVDRCLPASESIDLLNVAFEQILKHELRSKQKAKKSGSEENDPYEVPDRRTGLKGLEELRAVNPNRQWNFIKINISREELHRMRCERIKNLVYPLQTVLDDSIGCAVWFAARGQGELINSHCSKNFISKARK